MLIEEFATRHSLCARKDSCGDVIVGKPPRPRPEDCSHIFDAGKGKFGLVLLLNSRRGWTNAKKRLLAAGFELKQEGDTEGVFLFDPTDAQKVAASIKEAGIRAKNRISPEVRAWRASNLAAARKARLTTS